MTWRHVNAIGAALTAILWMWAEAATRWKSLNVVGDVQSIALLARISYLTAIFTFIAAWRADVPTEKE